MSEVRGVTIYFNDGTKLVIEYPKQERNEYDIVSKMKEILDNKHFLMEVDGAMVFIPVNNIKYMQVYPSPEKLPDYAILGARFIDT